jgi:hypothetical protein
MSHAHHDNVIHCTPPQQPSSCADGSGFNDLHVYDPETMTWTDLSVPAFGTPPSARISLGYTSAGGKLYVHGGFTFSAGADGAGVPGE